MKWIYLLIAGALEITWAVAMKMSNGFTVLIPSIVTGVGYIASAVFLAIALRQLPLGTAYAMWTGVYCKIKMQKVADLKCRLLQSKNVGNRNYIL